MTPLPDLLTARVRRDPSSPFLTYYASESERTELSARTFANWVDKTGNLLVDECEVDPGDRVRLALLDSRPAHWMTLVWVMGVWRAGAVITGGDADVVVTGPSADGGPGSYACSLHPLGLGLRDLPPGVQDFSTEALAQPDAWFGGGPVGDDPAWDVAGVRLTHAELADGTPSADRGAVIDAGDGLEVVRRALVGPLLGGGSTVGLSPDLDPAARERLMEAER